MWSGTRIMTTFAALAASAGGRTLRAAGFALGAPLGPGGFRLGDALAVGGEADDDIDAGIAEVERVGVALAAVADDGDCAAGEVIEISVFFVVAIWHEGS